PMTQLNTPYPSTAYLTGFLRSRGFQAAQADLSIGLALRLLSIDGLESIHREVTVRPSSRQTPVMRCFAMHFAAYRATSRAVIRFLQGKDPRKDQRIAYRSYLPEGPRFSPLDEHLGGDEAIPLDRAFGTRALQERAKHIATL